jgi:tetratricopeptide (TPR) repeat protein
MPLEQQNKSDCSAVDESWHMRSAFMSSDKPLELSNRIIAIGTDVNFGWLQPEEALEKVQGDLELSNLPDEQLKALIEETAQYWREKLEGEISDPEHIIIYPVLMSICAEERLKAIYQFGQGASDEVRSLLIPRLAQWITIFVQCLLDKGMAILLVPDSESAWQDFERAYQQASVGLDAEHLPLRETLWARYGQLISAQIANQAKEARMAEQELARLMQVSSRQQEAQKYIHEIQQDFGRILEILQKRQDFQRGQKLSTELSSNDPKTDTAPYINLLTAYGRLILEGRIKSDEAKQQLLKGYGPTSINLSKLTASDIYFASLFHLQLADSEPVLAIILADLNYAVSSSFRGDKAELVRTECAYALGTVLMRRARQLKGKPRRFNTWIADPEISAQAIHYLEEALAGYDSRSALDQESVVKGALIQASLVLCYNGVGDFEKAIELSHDAIRRLEALPAKRSDLGAVYGNLATAQIQIGKEATAFDALYSSVQIFLETNNMVSARKALSNLAWLGERVGRLDDALAAYEKALHLSVQVADLIGAAEIYSSLADLLYRAGRLTDLVRIVKHMSGLIMPHVSPKPREAQYLPLYFSLLIWLGIANTGQVKHEGATSDSLEEGRRALEEAREVAVQLQDNYRTDIATIQLIKLFMMAAESGRAEQYCAMIDATTCDPLIRAQYDQLLGEIRFEQKRYREAIDFFRQSIAVYTDLDAEGMIKGSPGRDVNALLLFRIGEAYKSLDELEEAVQAYEAALDILEHSRLNLYEESRMATMGKAIATYNSLILLYSDSNKRTYDPKKGLLWLEKSKSRTFVEMMGFSDIRLREPSKEVQADLLDEKELLQELNTLRSKLFISSEEVSDRLDLQRKIYTCLERLKGIWDKLAISHPEYVELRRGKIIDWDELQAMLV